MYMVEKEHLNFEGKFIDKAR